MAVALLSLMAVAQGGAASADESSGTDPFKDFCAMKSMSAAGYSAWEGVENLLPYEWSLEHSPQAMARKELYGSPKLTDNVRSKTCGADKKTFSDAITKYVQQGKGKLKDPCFQPENNALDKAALKKLAAYENEVRQLSGANCQQESGLQALFETKSAVYTKIVEQG